MSSLNPFLEDEVVGDLPDTKTASATSITCKDNGILLDGIAEELIKHKYILTALELYTEIQERGKDLQRLKNYFSNPSNFDLVNFKDAAAGGLYRTASTSTFDSLDMARYSDDGVVQVDEKVAVLEFELRKAKDTIKSLRANLTTAAEQQSSCLQETLNPANLDASKVSSGDSFTEQITPLELRAINHLVNEYLLDHSYKLSSITFADENVEQDFEDWDDVGINTPKPPDLLALYRDYSNHVAPKFPTSTSATQTNVVYTDEEMEMKENIKLIAELRDEVALGKKEKQQLKSKLDILQQEYNNYKKSCQKEEAVPDPPVQSTGDNVEKPETPTVDHTEATLQSNDAQTCEPEESRMPKALWEALMTEMQSTVEESWLKDEVLNVCVSADELVKLLGRCLPHIVPTVLLAKRDQLVPILLATAALHPDIEVRNNLLHILFNLMKKPDATQRQIILHGCTGYARHVGCHRAEEELLPQFWEQLGHKYPERRQLVAEACGAIAPYLTSEMRGSLLISILHQMQQEEKLEPVICSVVRSLALIYAFVDDNDKYNQAFTLFRSFLANGSASVREVCCLSLLPSIAMWSIQRGILHYNFFNELLKDVESAVSDKEKDSSFDQMLPLMYLLPYLFSAVLLEIQLKSFDDEELTDDVRVFDMKRDLENPSVIVGSDEIFPPRLRYFDAVISGSKISNDCQVLLWTTQHLVPRILNILRSFNPEFIEGLTNLAEMVDLFCLLFGKHYVEEKVLPQFVNIFDESSEQLSTCLLPVYVASILPVLENDRLRINDFLVDSIVKLSELQFSIENVKVALLLLRCKPLYHDVVIQALWSVVMHESALVRVSAASLLVVMTTSDVDTRVISSRVLPALITLSTDVQTNVRIATVSSFCNIMTNQSVGVDIVDRVITQLTEVVASSVENSFEEHSPDGRLLGLHSLRCSLINLIALVGAVLHPKFRDEFILPHLVAIAASNNQCEDAVKRALIAEALLEAYTCLSCCFIASNLLQGSVLPALKCLHTDIEKLQPEKLDDITALISEVERKLEQGSSTSDESSHPAQSSPGAGSTGVFRFDGAHQLGHAVSAGADDAKRKILNTFDQLKKKPMSPNLLSWRKHPK